MNKRTKILIRICVTAALLLTAFLVFHFAEVPENLWWIELTVYLALYGVIAYDILVKAAKGAVHGQILDENLLMIIATVGAFVVREYPEAILVMWLYQIGELFQSFALARSRKSIGSLMDIRPDSARLLRDGKEEVVSPEEVSVGDTVLVRPGEKIPLDGTVTDGESTLDTAALTGESVPVKVSVGASVLSGCINMSGLIGVRVEKEFYDSTASKILELVENASSRKAKAENFITKFARWYTPIVVIAALLLAIVPSLIAAFAPATGLPDWHTWVYRAMSFLVASCPCALVISIPLAFFGGIGGASKEGVLVKGGNYLELLAKADTFVMDKTGTVTKGVFEVQSVVPEERRAEILEAAAIAESASTHPIALSVLRAAGKSGADGYAIEEIAGKGVKATKGQDTILAGGAKLMSAYGIDFEELSCVGTVVYVARGGKCLGAITLGDSVKPTSKAAIKELKESGGTTYMLTGDNERVARAVAEEVGLDGVKAGLLPAGKVEELEKIMSEKGGKSVVAFVGDGINDAPVLMRADVGIAMGALGSDSAIEAADVVLMHDDLQSIVTAKKVAKRTVGISTQNIVFALVIKIAVLVLSMLGITDMWLAIFADVGVMVLAVLNAMRCLRLINKKSAERTEPKREKA